MNNELERALAELESELNLKPPFGSLKSSLKIRFLAVVNEIKNKICPRADQIIKAAKEDTSQMMTLITDAIISLITSTPFIATTLARYICIVGLDRFCSDPASIFDV